MVSQDPEIDWTDVMLWILAVLFMGWFVAAVLSDHSADANEQKAKEATVHELCVKGVTYYDFYGYTGAVSVALDKDGKVIPCGGKK